MGQVYAVRSVVDESLAILRKTADEWMSGLLAMRMVFARSAISERGQNGLFCTTSAKTSNSPDRP